jgi:hypothetical protein
LKRSDPRRHLAPIPFKATEFSDLGAYSRAKLPPNPDESCHSFHFKAATDSGEVCHPLEV